MRFMVLGALAQGGRHLAVGVPGRRRANTQRSIAHPAPAALDEEQDRGGLAGARWQDMVASPSRAVDERPILTADLLRQFDTPGPRYTSYPTADRFSDTFGAGEAASALAAVGDGRRAAALSLYLHIPFCESVCYYCACN